MAEQLFRLGNTQWWVLVDTVKEHIIQPYNKPQTQNTLAAIESQLATYPDPDQMQQDLQSLYWLVDNFTGATQERKDRVKQLIRDMWQSHEGSYVLMQLAELRAKHDHLTKLLAEMV
jgi:hypothetical protein